MKISNFLYGLLSIIILSSESLHSQGVGVSSDVFQTQGEQRKLCGENYMIQEYGLYAPKRHKEHKSQAMAEYTVSFMLDETAETDRIVLAIFGENIPESIMIRKFSSIGEASCKLPKGTYTMYAYYLSKDNMRCYVVFKDNVAVLRNMSIDFNVQDAKYLTEIKSYDEKSVLLQGDVKKDGQVLQLGNCRHLSTDVYFVHNKLGCLMTSFNNYYSPNYNFGIYTNDFGDNISLGATVKGIKKEDGSRYFLSYSSDKAGQTLENNPNDYARAKQRFEPTKVGRGYISIASPAYYVWSVYDSGALSNSFMFDYDFIVKDKIVSFWYDLPKSKDGKFMTLVAPAFQDQRTVIPSVGGSARYDYRYMVGLPLCGNVHGTEYVDFGYGLWYGYAMLPDGRQSIYPGHPVFSFTEKQEEFEYGNSCPILSMITIPDKKTLLLSYTYLGRYGEVRETDAKEESILHQDRDVKGDVVHHVITNSNVQVDNVAGYNITTLDYNTSRSDFVPPVLQMLRFVDTEGAITDRFNSGGDGYIELAAGDFDHIDNGKGLGYWSCKQHSVDVKLYYSEHGSEAWHPLSIELKPEHYWAQGFGDFFRGALSDVTGQRGWFDLKVELWDLSDNKQTQVLSPAFYIENPTTIYPILERNDVELKLEDSSIVITGLSNPQVSVYDSAGVMLIDKRGNSIPITPLANGTYLVKIVCNGKTYSKKVLLSH